MFKTDEQKRIAQCSRLINKDFPWLWAIRQKWDLAIGFIRVYNSDPNSVFTPHDFLHEQSVTNIKPFDKLEIWLRIEDQKTNMVSVEKVEPKPQWCWDEIISGFYLDMKKNIVITHIVLVEKTDREFPIITIFRPPKKERNFNNQIQEINLKYAMARMTGPNPLNLPSELIG